MSKYSIVLRKHKKELSDYKKSERERLKLIKDFEINEEVIVIYKKKEYNEKILKIYDKTYKVSFNSNDYISLDSNDYILFDKESRFGYPNSTVVAITGDGRRYIGENCKLVKKDLNVIR